MKTTGYIQPIPETAQMWRQLADAKLSKDRAEIGRLSAEIRTVTQRYGKIDEQRHSGGDFAGVIDCGCVVDG